MKINRSNVLFSLSIAGMAYAFYVLANKPADPTAVSIILTISSAVLSWVISDYYAAQQNSARIDGVGERSSEKILNQSKQLWEVEEYVRKQAEDLGDYSGSQVLISAREMLKIIRSSNNTYIGDWEGIVSEPVRRKMEERMEAQNRLFRAYAQGATEDRDSNTEIEEEKRALPTYLTPGFPTQSLKLASLLAQEVDRNTTTISKGRLRVRLNRDSYKFNFTGKLYPVLETVPEDLRARIVIRPNGAPQRIAVHAATGTAYDFHVHAKSNEYNVLLPAGDYVFEYIIRTEDPNAHEYGEGVAGVHETADGDNEAAATAGSSVPVEVPDTPSTNTPSAENQKSAVGIPRTESSVST